MHQFPNFRISASRFILLLTLLMLGARTAPAGDPPDPPVDILTIPWYSVDSGSAPVVSAGPYSLLGSIGQFDSGEIAREAGSASYALQGGYLDAPSETAMQNLHHLTICSDGNCVTSDQLDLHESPYILRNDPILKIFGAHGELIRVDGFLASDDEMLRCGDLGGSFRGWSELVPIAEIPADLDYVEVFLGETPNHRLPDEDTIQLRVTWLDPDSLQPTWIKNYSNVRVDTVSPRYLNALAPAGDFYARIDVHRPNNEDIRDGIDEVGFYCTDAVDGMTDQAMIEYRIEIFDSAEDAEIGNYIYRSNYSSENIPLATFRIDSEFSTTPLTLARGRYPENVVPWKKDVDEIKVDARGDGQYFWRVWARDDAGNESVSSLSEVWVPRADENLWLNTYDDDPSDKNEGFSRIRVSLWMPNNRFLSEWSPYTQELCFPSVWINEVNYNAISQDPPEQKFVEIAYAGPSIRSLDGWKLQVFDADTGGKITTVTDFPDFTEASSGNLWLAQIDFPSTATNGLNLPRHPEFALKNRCQLEDNNDVVWRIRFGGISASSAYDFGDSDPDISGISLQTTASYVSSMTQGVTYGEATATPGSANAVDTDIQTGPPDELVSKALVDYKAAFSATVFDADNDQERNKMYAEYIWKSARRWQAYLESYSENIERQQFAPSGMPYAYWYDSIAGESPQHLRMNYARLESDGRLRLEVYRDRYVTEESLYDPCDAIGRPTNYYTEGTTDPVVFDDLLRSGFDSYLQRLGKIDGNVPYPETREFGRRNVLVSANDWSGINWRWVTWGAVKVVTDGSYFYPQALEQSHAADGACFEGGSSWFGRSRGMSNGFSGASLRRVALLADPLERYMSRENQGTIFSSYQETSSLQDFSALRSEANTLSIEQATMQATQVSNVGTMAFVKQAFPIFEHLVRTPDGESVGVSGTASIINDWPYLANPTMDLPVSGSAQVGISRAFNFGYAGGYLSGHTMHEVGHGFGLGHSTSPLRGPARDTIMRNSNGFSLVASIYQAIGLVTSEYGYPHAERLLGSPEIDTRIANWGDTSGTSLKARSGPRLDSNTSSMVYWDPCNLRKLMTHPILLSSEILGNTPRDPIAKVAWPRDCSFAKMGQVSESSYVETPVSFYQLVDDTNINDGDALAYAGLRVFGFDSNAVGEGVDDRDPDDFKRLWPSEISQGDERNLRLYEHLIDGDRTEGIGFDHRTVGNDTDDDIYHLAFPLDIWTETATKQGAVGPGGMDGITAFYDHTAKRAGTIWKNWQPYRYVVSYAGSQPPSFSPDGTFNAPFLSIDSALSAPDAEKWFLILLPKDDVTDSDLKAQLQQDDIFYSSGISLSSNRSYAIIGGGETPDAITLKPATGAASSTLINIGSRNWGCTTHIGNMVLDGDNRTTFSAIRAINTGGGVHLGNLIIRGFSGGDAVKIEHVRAGGVFISNNTITGCLRGITVDAVEMVTADTMKEWDAQYASVPMGLKALGRERVFYASSIESNLLVNCSDYAIKIGSSSAPYTATAWAPFDEAIGEDEEGNPLVPVRNNMVWNCGASRDAAFQGDSWYRSLGVLAPDPNVRYGPVTQREFGEVWYWATEAPPSPDIFEDFAAGDYRLGANSPALGAGSPYRIDIFPGTETSSTPKVMRRSVGALASHRESDYAVLSSE